MSELWRRSRWVLAAAALAVGVAFGAAQLFGRGLADEPLALAPAEAGIVLSVDAQGLMRSRAWRALLDERGQGARRIARTCGYDPLEQLESVVVFVSGAAERPFEHVGFVARGEMARGVENRARLVRCVGQVLSEQGGATRRVEVEGVPAIASASGGSHAAFLGADGVVGGDREVVARTIRVSRGDAPTALGRPALRALYARVAERSEVVLVAALPERWLPALRRMAGGLPASFDALTEVRALAFGARVTGGLDARLVLRVGAPARAPALAGALESLVDGALAEPGTSLTVLGSLLRRITIRRVEGDVEVAAQMSDDLFEDLVGLWRATSSGSLGDLDLDDVARGGAGLDGGARAGGARGGGALDGGALGDAVLDAEPGDHPGDHEDHE